MPVHLAGIPVSLSLLLSSSADKPWSAKVICWYSSITCRGGPSERMLPWLSSSARSHRRAVNGGEIMRNEDHGTTVFAQFCNPFKAFRLKGRIADGEDFVQQEDIRIEVCSNGKTQADKHAG